MTNHNFPECGIPAARCFYRASAELIQHSLDANESPNGEAKRGSQRYRNLMAAMTSFIRLMSSWAQLEFDNRYAGPQKRHEWLDSYLLQDSLELVCIHWCLEHLLLEVLAC